MSTDAIGYHDPRQLLLHNGPILTMDRERPEVDALLGQFGRIVAVGSLDDVSALA